MNANSSYMVQTAVEAARAFSLDSLSESDDGISVMALTYLGVGVGLSVSAMTRARLSLAKEGRITVTRKEARGEYFVRIAS